MSEARVVRLIATTSLVGDGTKDRPYTTVAELWTLDGQLVACHDPHTGESMATGQIAGLQP